MKTIRIAFEGFWEDFNYADNFIVNILKKYYHVQIVDTKAHPDARKKVQYLFCSEFSDNYIDYDCIRIYYTGENIFPNMNAFDYAIGFEHFSLGDRYIRYPLYLACYSADVERMLEKHQKIDEVLLRRKFCSMVVSNGVAVSPARRDFFECLSVYKRVDSGGKYLNNIGCPEGVANKEEFQKKYKFSIAFENSSDIGYCTEKLVQSFAAKTVPIYWGDPLVGETFNEGAFVNCHNFNSFEEAVEYIKKIDKNDSLYLEMLKEPAVSKDILENENEKFEKWLYHIIEQKYDNAFRRKRYGRYYTIEEEMRNKKYMRSMEETIGNFAILKKVKRKIYNIYSESKKANEKNAENGIIYEPEREYEFGNKNPEIIFYVVRREGKRLGLLSFFNTHLGHIVYAISKGYIPIVDMQNYPNIYLEDSEIGSKNSWEYYFKQPYGKKYSLEEVYNSKRVIFSSLEPIFPRPDDDMDFLMNERARRYWHKIYLEYSKVNETIMALVMNFYESVFMPCISRGERILGSCLRGTDYYSLRPSNHPIQPDIEEAINEIEEAMKKWRCSKIYLVTEDIEILNEMTKTFGEKLIRFNSQMYRYNGRGYLSDMGSIARNNDRYEHGKEYLCSVLLLTKCNCFIGGRTSGTVAMHIMSEGFENKRFFDYGRYGKEDYLDWEI